MIKGDTIRISHDVRFVDVYKYLGETETHFKLERTRDKTYMELRKKDVHSLEVRKGETIKY